MNNILNSKRINIVNSLAVITLVLTLALTTLINTQSLAQVVEDNSEALTTQSTVINNSELEWVEDNSEVFYPTSDDTILTDEEVKNLGLEIKLNQKTSQDLNLEFKTDFKKELNLKAGLTDTASRQAELNLVANSINADFQAELQAKRDQEAKQITEFNKLSKIYNDAAGLYNDVAHKVDGILKTENQGVKVVTDIVLDNIGMDNNLKAVTKLLLNGTSAPSDYQRYNFDQDINKLKNLFK
jgi:hypothetical protein